MPAHSKRHITEPVNNAFDSVSEGEFESRGIPHQYRKCIILPSGYHHTIIFLCRTDFCIRGLGYQGDTNEEPISHLTITKNWSCVFVYGGIYHDDGTLSVIPERTRFTKLDEEDRARVFELIEIASQLGKQNR